MKDKIEIIINDKRYIVTDDSFKFVVEDDKVLHIQYDDCGVSVGVRKAEV